MTALAALAVATACGSGLSTVTGRVSDVSGRLCVQHHRDEGGDCFAAGAEQLRGLVVGKCVRVTYRTTTGSLPPADEVAPAPAPCFS